MATIQEQIEREKAALAFVEDKFTGDVAAEIEARAELDALRAKREEKERTLRELFLSQREDAAREALGEKAKIGAVSIQDYPDVFVLVHDPNAYKAWDAAMTPDPSGRRKVDRGKANAALALASVFDWNGITDWSVTVKNSKGGDTPAGDALRAYLADNPGLVTPLVNEAGRLAGLYKEERKSGR